MAMPTPYTAGAGGLSCGMRWTRGGIATPTDRNTAAHVSSRSLSSRNRFPRLCTSVYCRAAKSLSIAAHWSFSPWAANRPCSSLRNSNAESCRTRARESSHHACGRRAASPAASSPSEAFPPLSKVACTGAPPLRPSGRSGPFAKPTCRRTALRPSRCAVTTMAASANLALDSSKPSSCRLCSSWSNRPTLAMTRCRLRPLIHWFSTICRYTRLPERFWGKNMAASSLASLVRP